VWGQKQTKDKTMNIIAALNSGSLHAAARERRPDCVCENGSIHSTPERAKFVDWMRAQKITHGEIVQDWPAAVKRQYEARYVPSH